MALDDALTLRGAADRAPPPSAAPESAPDAVPEGASAERAAEQQRVLLHMPVDVRSLSLAVLAVLASVVVLHWAREVLIPLLLGVMLSYALTPIVDRLEQWRLPRFAAAGLVMTALVGAFGWTAWALADDAEELIESLPAAALRIRELTTDARGPKPGAIEKVQAAATELERAAVEAAAPASAASGALPRTAPASAVPPRREAAAPPARVASEPAVQRVVVEKPRFNVRDYIWSGALGVAFFVGQLTVIVFICFFLLAAGTTFRRKMVKLAGPKLSQKRITLQALDEVGDHIKLYLLVQAATSVLVGVLTGVAFWLIGLNQAAVWGFIAGVTNLIPYLGAILVGGASGVVGWLQFGSFDMGLLVGGASFFIHMIVGNVITPLWTGRANRMNPFAVFVAVLAFGWLWGIWGLLLGVPILVVVKTVCDRVDELKPVGELLGV